jgi:hypothetical protein
MREIRNWYQLLEGTGLVAHDLGPGQAHGTLTANIAWLPFYHPPGTLYTYKGVTIAAATSRITSAAAAGFNSASGSIEMLCRPGWAYNDGSSHTFWDCNGGNNHVFRLTKNSGGTTELYTDNTSRGTFTYAWASGTLYHIVLNWGTNALYINKVLEKTFTAGTLGIGASTLSIGDQLNYDPPAFKGDILYFISRDVPLTQAEINAFYTFFMQQYIAD